RSCPACRGSILGFEFALVLADERADLVGHVEKPTPLLLVERHGKATEPVHGDPALVTDPHLTAALRSGLQGFVLGPEAGNLALEMLLAHGPSTDEARAASSPGAS